MSREEFVKIRTCELRVSIHCDGCQRKVKRILQKIDGIYKSTIDSEQSKVTISGNVDPDTVIKKLVKKGKRAELWDAPKPNNDNQNQLNNIKIDANGDGGKKGPAKKNKNTQQPLNGGHNQPIPNLQQLPQLQQIRGFQDTNKLPPQLRDMKMPNLIPNLNPKAVKNNAAEVDLGGDDDDDGDFDDDGEFDEDEFDDDGMDDILLPNKMKAMMGNGQGGGQKMPPNLMMSGLMNGHVSPAQLPPHLMKGALGGGDDSSNGGPNGKKVVGQGGVGNIPVQINPGGGSNGSGGKKKGGSGNNDGNQNPGTVKEPKNGNGGGARGAQNKKGGAAGGAQNENGSGGAAAPGGNDMNGNGNGEKKSMANMTGMGGGAGQIGGGIPMAQPPQMGPMGIKPMDQIGPMGQMSAVQGRPIAAPGGYPGLDAMPDNPYQQQQMAAMMMSQQRANGNERFQPMMYARPPPAVSYMPPQPYQPYQQYQPYQHQQYQPYQHDSYPEPQYNTYYSEEENTSSCSIM